MPLILIENIFNVRKTCIITLAFSLNMPLIIDGTMVCSKYFETSTSTAPLSTPSSPFFLNAKDALLNNNELCNFLKNQ